MACMYVAGAAGIEKLADFGVELGYVAVRQDMRGTGQSQGFFLLWGDGTDAYGRSISVILGE